MIRTHGGDWAAYKREFGAEPLDFSANVSPLGVPESARRAVCGAAASADRYPDPDCRALREAIAAHEGVRAEQVLCGNGASELLYRAAYALRPKRALVTAPAFGEYEAALDTCGCALRRVPLDDTFHMTGAFVREITGQISLAVLCQPNNPSGVTVDPALLQEIAARCHETGTRLLVDECFVDFLDEPERYRTLCALRAIKGRGENGTLLDTFPEVIILKAFTKLYGLAGLRLGYVLCGDAALLDAMRYCAPPWSVSGVAQAAGVTVLADVDYVNQVRTLIGVERPWLNRQLCSLGLSVIPGEANFLLFRGPAGLNDKLRRRGILIRCCADFAGLDEGWYRTAVRTREENERLVSALREVLL
ncbi:MAG: aminotransferase class I/II-fold pyridoxal phosphate-dependent enzyme [Ruminococcaceae bacterium]|nr:aminotransferase class I/II-fold pyridoxal phosphate-dependent enzyme [Oscillospiraceae bacterium]